jgi:hypothetical protein
MVIRLVSFASTFNGDISVDKLEYSANKSPFNSEIGYGNTSVDIAASFSIAIK